MNDLSRQKHAVKWLRLLYPSWAIVGMFSLMYVPSTLIDLSNSELTASNIASNTFLFRAGIAGALMAQLFSVPVVYFLYKLFFQSYKDAVILLAVFAFLGMPIAMYSNVHQLTALEMLGHRSAQRIKRAEAQPFH